MRILKKKFVLQFKKLETLFICASKIIHKASPSRQLIQMEQMKIQKLFLSICVIYEQRTNSWNSFIYAREPNKSFTTRNYFFFQS